MKRTWRSSAARLIRQPPGPAKAVIFLLTMIAYSTAGFMFFESHDKPELRWIDALWWSLVTMATVGYGDYFPATAAGRLFVGIPSMLVGVGMLGYALGQITSFFFRAERLNRKGLAMVKAKDHVIVCNFPGRDRFLRIVSEIVRRPGATSSTVVLVDEQLTELDDDIFRHEIKFVRGHPARAATFERANLADASRAIVLARDPTSTASDDLTLATCLTLRHLRPEMHLVAECVDPENREVLERAGCQSIVCALDLAPGILAHELCRPGLAEVLGALTTNQGGQVGVWVASIAWPAANTKTYQDLTRWGLANHATVLGITRDNQVLFNPALDIPLLAGDGAVVLATDAPEQIGL